jgi:hypothetical protein
MLQGVTAQYLAELPHSDRFLLKLLAGAPGAHDAKRPHADADAEVLPGLAPEWEPIIARAAECSLTPLLFGALRAHDGKNAVPVEIYGKLQADYQVITLHNMVLYQKLHTILSRLQSHAIDVIPIKGIYLAQVIYQDIGLRPMSDIDLLIHAQNRARTLDVMAELGFQPSNEKSGETNGEIESAKADFSQAGHQPAQGTQQDDATLLRERHHDRLTHVTSGLSVEIHWALVKQNSPYLIDYDALWQRATNGKIVGIGVRVLSPIDTLLHQCIHLCYQHVVQHYTLRGLCDIQHLIAFYGDRLDWEQFCRLTEEWRAQRSAHLALFLAHVLVDARVPLWVLQRLQPAQMDERVPRWAIDRALGYVDDRVGPWSSNTARWHLATGWSQKMRVAYHICFPPPQQLAAAPQAQRAVESLWVARLRHWGKLARVALADRWRRSTHIAKDAAVSWHEREIGRTALTTWLHEQPEDAR